MRFVLAAFLLTGCNALDRPQLVSQAAVGDDEVVTLPGGGALLIQRALRQPQCLVRARGFNGLMPMDCDLAGRVRP